MTLRDRENALESVRTMHGWIATLILNEVPKHASDADLEELQKQMAAMLNLLSKINKGKWV